MKFSNIDYIDSIGRRELMYSFSTLPVEIINIYKRDIVVESLNKSIDRINTGPNIVPMQYSVSIKDINSIVLKLKRRIGREIRKNKVIV